MLQNQSHSKPCPLGFPCQSTTHYQPPLPTPHPFAQKPTHFPNLFPPSHIHPHATKITVAHQPLPRLFPQTNTHQKSSGAQSYPPPPPQTPTPTPTINNNPTITTPPHFTSHTPSSYTTMSSITTSPPSSSIQNLEDKVALQGSTIDTGLTSTRPIRRTSRLIWLKDYI
ncbi:hypothetical protein PHAVU_002G066766 [Phaseolus vulgaris]